MHSAIKNKRLNKENCKNFNVLAKEACRHSCYIGKLTCALNMHQILINRQIKYLITKK